MTREVDKVVCYVIEHDHLLVFTHDAIPLTVTGVQVPAGSIEADESPEDAALRELTEETGRDGQVVRLVGVDRYDLRPTRDEIAVRHFVEMRMAPADIAERWAAQELTPAHGGEPARWTCWWLPLDNAHVLSAGLGSMLGVTTRAVR
ncbi:NUDIX domain-containing protein [Clavibacter michiganensis]|uniref:NUDIX domain-containing protein n=1 Tax=Clavibacter michiganensis TaxID=28447 RepID=UPI0005B97F67|nr:NUDIX domain-containing protein [Clavibacter michiganensis]